MKVEHLNKQELKYFKSNDITNSSIRRPRIEKESR